MPKLRNWLNGQKGMSKIKFISQVNLSKVNNGVKQLEDLIKQAYKEKPPTFEERVIELLENILDILQGVNK